MASSQSLLIRFPRQFELRGIRRLKRLKISFNLLAIKYTSQARIERYKRIKDSNPQFRRLITSALHQRTQNEHTQLQRNMCSTVV